VGALNVPHLQAQWSIWVIYNCVEL
jgi:hypothetical protein